MSNSFVMKKDVNKTFIPSKGVIKLERKLYLRPCVACLQSCTKRPKVFFFLNFSYSNANDTKEEDP